MKKTIYINGLLLSALCLFAVFYQGCKEPKEEHETKPAIPVVIYTLAKLDKATHHKLASDKIRSVISSGDGEFVYVVGTDKASLKSFEVAKGDKGWGDALGDWKAIKRARTKKFGKTDNLSARTVKAIAPTKEGMLFTVSDDKGLVVLKGSGEANAMRYLQAGKLAFPVGKFAPFFVTKKDNKEYVYLSIAGKTAVPKKGVLFRSYVAPAATADNVGWDNTLKAAAGKPLAKVFTARTQDHDKNLLLADADGIKRLKEADVGKPGAFLDNGGAAVYPIKDFMLDGKTPNPTINTMALVGDKFLVVGLASNAANNGGLVYADITAKTPPVWHRFGEGAGLSVDFIAVARKAEPGGLSAIITTDKGYLFFKDGKVIEPADGKGSLVDEKFIAAHKGNDKDYDKAASGFAGADIKDPGKEGYLGAAQDKNGVWYLAIKGNADEGGIFTLVVTHGDVPFPPKPPEMP